MADFFVEKIPKVFTLSCSVLCKTPDSALYVLNRAFFMQISNQIKKNLSYSGTSDQHYITSVSRKNTKARW